MKAIYKILLTALLSIFVVFIANTQVTVHAEQIKSYELEIVNQLTTSTAVVNMPVSQLLNAPGNEALKTFFFTPVTKKTLAGKKIAVIAADGFEEIELTGPVWYFKQLGAHVEIIAPKFNPAPERYGLVYPEMSKTHIMAIQYLQPVGWIILLTIVQNRRSRLQIKSH